MIHCHKEWSLINLCGRCRVDSKSWLDRKTCESDKWEEEKKINVCHSFTCSPANWALLESSNLSQLGTIHSYISHCTSGIYRWKLSVGQPHSEVLCFTNHWHCVAQVLVWVLWKFYIEILLLHLILVLIRNNLFINCLRLFHNTELIVNMTTARTTIAHLNGERWELCMFADKSYLLLKLLHFFVLQPFYSPT